MSLDTTADTLWNSADLDLDAYLARVGQSPRNPSIEALSALHEAHIRTIPFENVDVLLGRTPSLELADIVDKLVRRRRGGYCFEHGLLFAAALDLLGYRVTRCVARVAFDRPDSPRTHLMLLVDLDGIEYLADVGFGSPPLAPLPLLDGAATDHGGWPFRMRRDGRYWLLEKPGEHGWQVAHGFDDAPQRPVDYVVANHYTATHPRSVFTQRLIVQRRDHGSTRKLVGSHLSTEYTDGTRERDRVVGPDELGEVLESLGIVVADDELALLRQVYAGPESAPGKQRPD